MHLFARSSMTVGARAVTGVVDAFAPLDVIDRFLAIVGRLEDDSQS